jgi:hypothetical protein
LTKLKNEVVQRGGWYWTDQTKAILNAKYAELKAEEEQPENLDNQAMQAAGRSK